MQPRRMTYCAGERKISAAIRCVPAVCFNDSRSEDVQHHAEEHGDPELLAVESVKANAQDHIAMCHLVRAVGDW